MKKISILGCGWLGLPLAKLLLEKGFYVKGSTTSVEKISALANVQIKPFLLELSTTTIKGEVSLFLENSEILVIDIPPKLRGTADENFVGKIEVLIPFIEKSSVKKVLFVSSTSVFADDNTICSEAKKPRPDTENGQQLWQVEQLLQSNKAFKTTVVRFGGLIGEDRHPVYFLAGKKELQNPEGPINLIHQMDCIGIIESTIDQDFFGETLNAVAPFHPTRKDYYTQKAIEWHLPTPEFDVLTKSVGKTIVSTKIEPLLGYKYKNTNL